MQFNMPGPKSGILMLRVRRLLLLVAAFIAPTGAPSGVCSRAPKRGVAVHTAQSCDVRDAHSISSWWYSWGLGTGFDGSFCDAPDDAAARAPKAAERIVAALVDGVDTLDALCRAVVASCVEIKILRRVRAESSTRRTG